MSATIQFAGQRFAVAPGVTIGGVSGATVIRRRSDKDMSLAMSGFGLTPYGGRQIVTTAPTSQLQPYGGSQIITTGAPAAAPFPTSYAKSPTDDGGGVIGNVAGALDTGLDLVKKAMGIFGLGGGGGGMVSIPTPQAGPGITQSGVATDIAIGVAGGAVGELIHWMMGGGSAKTGGMVPRGYHANKVLQRYVVAVANGHKNLKDPTKQPRVRNAIVRNRSMNSLNPRALKRAEKRVKKFAGHARKALGHLGYHVSRTAHKASFGGKRRKK